ncbi:MAG: hypothetical protein ACE14S_04445 [Candidatus Bathyarchaeia archaeon]
MNDDFSELLKNVQEETRKHSTLEMNEKYLLKIDIDVTTYAEALKILNDVKANVPKTFKGKQVRVYMGIGFSL